MFLTKEKRKLVKHKTTKLKKSHHERNALRLIHTGSWVATNRFFDSYIKDSDELPFKIYY